MVVPLNAPGMRKTRLAPALDPAAREALALAMFSQVMAVLQSLPSVRPLLLSPERPAGWSGAWRAETAPLNSMLERMRDELITEGFAVINADLPLLTAADVQALLDTAGKQGVALATDRHGHGTNAVALAPGERLRFCFGPGSATAFRTQRRNLTPMPQRPGLAIDIDDADDLAHLQSISSHPLANRQHPAMCRP